MALEQVHFQRALERAAIPFPFPPEGLQGLAQFSLKMLEINRSLNLTKWTEEEDFLNHHFLDSAQVLGVLAPLIQGPQRWMDLGTGCGFPGAVLAAAFPQLEVTLMDSVAKKIKALEACIAAAGWKTRTLTGRAEEWGRDPRYRESWDGITARAVADLRVVLEYAFPLLKTGGYLVNWMTEEQWASVDKAQGALTALKGKIVQTHRYSLPGLSLSRFLVLVEKLGTTSMSYPRSPGQASKDPL